MILFLAGTLIPIRARVPEEVYRSTMHQILFKSFLQQETFENKIGKEPQKPCPKLKNIISFIYSEYLLSLQPGAGGSYFANMY